MLSLHSDGRLLRFLQCSMQAGKISNEGNGDSVYSDKWLLVVAIVARSFIN